MKLCAKAIKREIDRGSLTLHDLCARYRTRSARTRLVVYSRHIPTKRDEIFRINRIAKQIDLTLKFDLHTWSRAHRSDRSPFNVTSKRSSCSRQLILLRDRQTGETNARTSRMNTTDIFEREATATHNPTRVHQMLFSPTAIVTSESRIRLAVLSRDFRARDARFHAEADRAAMVPTKRARRAELSARGSLFHLMRSRVLIPTSSAVRGSRLPGER